MAMLAANDELAREVCKALDIDPCLTRRIILDFPYEGPVLAYVEMYASNKILKVDWAAGLSCAEIKVLDEA